MRRRWLVQLGVIAVVASVGAALTMDLVDRPLAAAARLFAAARSPIVVGLVHSLTGPLAISEKSLLDAEVLALEEVNARGGVAGRPLKWFVADGRSDPAAFATEARRLIEADGAKVLFGSYSAECRKAVRAVVEDRASLLIVGATFEGLEPKGRVIYAGGSANQTTIPAVRWCVESLKARRFFVAGSDEAWSRCVAELAKDAVRASGASTAGEASLPLRGADVGALVEAIGAAKPDVVINAMLGESNAAFYAGLRRAGLTPEKLPVVALSIGEDELRQVPPGDVAGHYAAMNYFQTVDRPENREFVAKFKARYGADRVTSDPIVAAYNGVMLWAKAADEAGTGEPGVVLAHLGRQSLDAPEGIITVDPGSRVVWRPFHVGRARPDGQFDVAWSLARPIYPRAYPLTRSKVGWRAFVEGIQADRERRGSAPAPSK